MYINEAITKRIWEISEEQQKSIYDICLKGGMSPSAIYDITHKRIKSSKVVTIKRFCKGAGITLSEFFAPTYFNDLQDEND